MALLKQVRLHIRNYNQTSLSIRIIGHNIALIACELGVKGFLCLPGDVSCVVITLSVYDRKPKGFDFGLDWHFARVLYSSKSHLHFAGWSIDKYLAKTYFGVQLKLADKGKKKFWFIVKVHP